jgi:8-amino-7-oxononanoate synthase
MNMLDELRQIESDGLLRRMRTLESAQDRIVKIDGREYISFCSNNYLGLCNHPRVKKAAIAAIEKYGVGAGASRLISGNFSLHNQLEKRIARFKGTESALVFPTGYMANVGTVSALVGPGDAIICDRLNHASIIDGARLSRAKLLVYRHTDSESLEEVLKQAAKYRTRLLITDSVFSMDGDVAQLDRVGELAEKYDATLMIDEAHAVGFLGNGGRGAVEHFGLNGKIPVVMGTLSKAIGSVGGYIAGSADLIEYLRNKSRSFIYTTALPPAACAAAIAAIDIIETTPALVENLKENSRYLRIRLAENNINTLNSTTQIIPIITGTPQSALDLSQKLYENGILTPAIRPPTVPRGTSRIRISLMAQHTKQDIDKLLEIVTTK